jgi:Rab GDP dissociation inhibitor
LEGEEKHSLKYSGLDINKVTMKEVYTKFGLEAGTQDFIGHAMALWLDDRWVASQRSKLSILC